MSEEGSAAASESGPPALSGVDVATLVVFFLMLGSVSVWATRKQQASQSASASSETYFLAERAVPFWAVGASLFMSNIGAEHFVGLAGTAARSGIAVGWYEWGAMPAVLVMGYFFLPVYSSMGVSTMPEYIERRYNKKARTLLVCLSLVLYIFTKISATLFAGQVVLDAVSHLNPWLSAALMIVGTAAYTTLGGLSAVVYTEAMQTVVLLVGGGILAFVGFSEVGGLPGLRKELPDSFFHLFRPVTDKDFPWTGFVSGYYMMSLWYWGCDQAIVQRALSAKNIRHGRGGAVMTSVLKSIPVFMMVIPGMIARVLMERDGVIDKEAPTDDPAVYDRAYPWLIVRIMPAHTHGLLLAAILSSLMSSLASVFNSSATLFTMDVYRTWRPESSEKHLVWVGRVCVVVVAILSLAWLPIIPLFGANLFLYIQTLPAFLAPSIFALFIWGMTSRKPSGSGGYVALVWGTALGLSRFALSIVDATSGHTGFDNSVLHWIVTVNFLHFAVFAFVSASAVLFFASASCRGSEDTGGSSQLSSARDASRGFEMISRHNYRNLIQQQTQRAGGAGLAAAGADEVDLGEIELVATANPTEPEAARDTEPAGQPSGRYVPREHDADGGHTFDVLIQIGTAGAVALFLGLVVGFA